LFLCPAISWPEFDLFHAGDYTVDGS